MPRMDAAIYAAHLDNVLKLAKRKEGVSRPEIISELNVTRAVANGLIEKCGLALDRKDGRTEYYTSNGEAKPTPEPEKVEAKVEAKQSKVAAPAQAAAVPESTDAAAVSDDDVAELDAQILDTRDSMRKAAAAAGKALGEWATQQALVDALRERMTKLAVRRMNASS